MNTALDLRSLDKNQNKGAGYDLGQSSMKVGFRETLGSIFDMIREGAEHFLRGAGKKAAVTATGAAMALGAVSAKEAEGAFISDINNDPYHVALGQEYAGKVVWIQGKNNAGNPYMTHGVLLNDEYVLASAHRVPSATSTATIDFVGNGTNYISDPGTVVAAESWMRHPDYVANSEMTPDIAIIKLASPLPSHNLSISTNAPVKGEKWIAVGFGPVQSPTTPAEYTGDIRGWEMHVEDWVSGSQDPNLYVNLGSNSEYAISGDSSSIFFNKNGEIAGIF